MTLYSQEEAKVMDQETRDYEEWMMLRDKQEDDDRANGKIYQYNNKGKIFQSKGIYSKIFKDPEDEDKGYEWNKMGYRGIGHVGIGWQFYGTEKGLMTASISIQLIWIWIGPIIGLNDDLF
jgi:hypothetical protein